MTTSCCVQMLKLSAKDSLEISSTFYVDNIIH